MESLLDALTSEFGAIVLGIFLAFITVKIVAKTILKLISPIDDNVASFNSEGKND